MEEEERVLDANQWKIEAEAIINDVKSHVRNICLCDDQNLQSSNHAIYLNLTILEDRNYNIKLSSAGFSIVINELDDESVEEPKYYETVYALLNEISPKFKESFGNNLINKLKMLSEQENNSE